MRAIIIGVIIFIILILIFWFLKSVKICNGGELFHTGCGKILFPWQPKFKLPSGKICCMQCYIKDLKLFSEMVESRENQKLTFKVEDEKVPFEDVL